MPDLLFELGVEEIPARFLAAATVELAERGGKALEDAGFRFSDLTAWSTPRRLILFAKELCFDESRAYTRKKGPSEKVAFGAEEQPTPALLGFLRKEGATLQQVQREDGYIYINKKSEKKPAQLLAEMLPPVAAGLPFPKLMRWGEGDFLYVRPARWALCLYGEECIPFSLLGVETGVISQGHRFFGGPVTIGHPAEYAGKLEEAFVLVDPAARRARLETEGARLAAEVGGSPYWAPLGRGPTGRPEVPTQEGLAEELVHLLEYPTAFRGSFDSGYLDLPPEVLITVMRHHQKQVPISDEEGRLLPYFLCFRDGPPVGEGIVVRGNEQALQGRLEDARLFFRLDQAKPLADRVADLGGIKFHEKLGSMDQKAKRLESLAGRLAAHLQLPPEEQRRAKRAALLAKADLTTAMVGELPELQGIMGREYARLAGEEPDVVQGIAEHYQPRSLGDELPATWAGTLAGLADRLDTLAAFFALNMEPSGSADPFALRRAAQGLLAILVEKELPLSLEELVTMGAEAVAKLAPLSVEGKSRLLSFLTARLRFLLEERGVSFEVISCAIGTSPLYPAQAALKAELVRAQLGMAELIALALSAKRIKNILKSAGPFRRHIIEKGMEEAEAALHSALRWAQSEDRGTPQASLAVLLALTPQVSQFFDRVLVMAEEKERRESRLSLLTDLRDLYGAFGDFSALPY